MPEDRNCDFPDGPRACPWPGCGKTFKNDNSLSSHKSRCSAKVAGTSEPRLKKRKVSKRKVSKPVTKSSPWVHYDDLTPVTFELEQPILEEPR